VEKTKDKPIKLYRKGLQSGKHHLSMIANAGMMERSYIIFVEKRRNALSRRYIPRIDFSAFPYPSPTFASLEMER
jgi:hypothetical protein